MSRTRRPSLFDLQVNGFAGVDFQRPDVTGPELRRACEALQQRHTRRILLTLVTDSIRGLEAKFARFEALRAADPLPRETIVGYHLEGPYISPEEGYRGGHLARYIKAPDWGEFRRLQEAAHGAIRLVTLAPEWPGSAGFIRRLVGSGVVVSLGHTNASHRDIEAAIRAGATLCTHLGNACRATMPRHDNIIQRLLARDELIAAFIPDGIHVPPPVLKNFLRAKPPGRVVLTTDAVAAAAAPPGPFVLRRGGKARRFYCNRQGVIRMPGTKDYFFGSSLTLDRGIANAAAWSGASFDRSWEWGSVRPARIFGVRLPEVLV